MPPTFKKTNVFHSTFLNFFSLWQLNILGLSTESRAPRKIFLPESKFNLTTETTLAEEKKLNLASNF